MDELVRWLGVQLDEDERIARVAANELEGLELGSEWRYDGRSVETVRERTMVAVGSQDFMEPGVGGHVAEHDPARVLREIDAKRELLRQYEHLKYEVMPDDLTGVWAFEAVLRAHALVYAGRPGYRDEWRP
ncbi:DUF6221 family protein [Streptomyces albogriseolus]|uniref:DUF6221 family protein n=1 Tax=Streptomyces albogriseolus TaxID=1887 RepID=UPI003810271D